VGRREEMIDGCNRGLCAGQSPAAAAAPVALTVIWPSNLIHWEGLKQHIEQVSHSGSWSNAFISRRRLSWQPYPAPVRLSAARCCTLWWWVAAPLEWSLLVSTQPQSGHGARAPGPSLC